RLRERPHRPDQRVVASTDLVGEGLGVGLESLVEILAGTERPAGAGEDDGPHGVVRREGPERRDQPLLERDGQGVERVWSVEGDGADPVGRLDPEIRHLGQAGAANPRASTRRPSTSSKTRRSTGSSAPPELSMTKSAKRLANSSSPGRSAPAIRRWRSGTPTRTRPTPPSSDISLSITSGRR